MLCFIKNAYPVLIFCFVIQNNKYILHKNCSEFYLTVANFTNEKLFVRYDRRHNCDIIFVNFL